MWRTVSQAFLQTLGRFGGKSDFLIFLGKTHIFRTMTASELNKKHLETREKLYKK